TDIDTIANNVSAASNKQTMMVLYHTATSEPYNLLHVKAKCQIQRQDIHQVWNNKLVPEIGRITWVYITHQRIIISNIPVASTAPCSCYVAGNIPVAPDPLRTRLGNCGVHRP
ncbi:MAG: hypothetical protein ACKPKO_28545, partial [Candidatus Fonsibacter sp.]